VTRATRRGAVRVVIVAAAAAVLAVAGVGPATALPAARPAACPAGQLHGSFTDLQGSTGHYHAVLVVRNVGAGPCTLFGYPALQMFDAAGQPLTTSVTPDHFLGRARRVLLRRGARASSALTWVEIPPEPCVTPAHVGVTPPGATTSLTLLWPPQHNLVCGDGAIDATPFLRGVPRF